MIKKKHTENYLLLHQIKEIKHIYNSRNKIKEQRNDAYQIEGPYPIGCMFLEEEINCK
jgi:hypothetical protein